jgi:NDP-sugar pyrophosphorylase family protein
MKNISACDVVILAGGLGSRLRSEVGQTQKIMADVGGRPFLDIILDHLVRQGFKRIILCTGYGAASVEDYYRKLEGPLTIEFSREQEKLGTGGAIKNAAPLVQSETFFAMNGDSFCAVCFKDFLAFHQARKARASVAVSRVRRPDDYGSLLIDPGTQQVVFFGEKIKAGTAAIRDKEPFVNNGVYCFQKDIFEVMPQARAFSLEEDCFREWAGRSFYGFEVKQEFIDIGVPERYQQAKKKWD